MYIPVYYIYILVLLHVHTFISEPIRSFVAGEEQPRLTARAGKEFSTQRAPKTSKFIYETGVNTEDDIAWSGLRCATATRIKFRSSRAHIPRSWRLLPGARRAENVGFDTYEFQVLRSFYCYNLIILCRRLVRSWVCTCSKRVCT